MLKVLDLFSGIGGFSIGLERTGGFETVAFCEINPFCRRVLAQYWPEVPILDDVRTADFPAVDVIVGGFPCQDVSRAGKRAGITGERSGLYRELVRAIRLVGPRYAIVENVAALLADGMGDVLGDLAEAGLVSNGIAFRRRPSAPLTSGTGYGSSDTLPTPRLLMTGAVTERRAMDKNPNLEVVLARRLLPTPRSSDADRGGRGDLLTVLRGYETRHAGTLPTPTARDWRSGKASTETHDRNARPLNEALALMSGNAAGHVNPRFLEWMMGYPIGWTELRRSGTPSCPKSPT